MTTMLQQFTEGYQSLMRFIPKREPHAFKTLQERETASIADQLKVVAQHARQPIVGNAVTQMMNMVNPDIGRVTSA